LTVTAVTVVALETVKLTVTCCPVFAGFGVVPVIVATGLLLLVQMFVCVRAATNPPLAFPSGPPLTMMFALAPTVIPLAWSHSV